LSFGTDHTHGDPTEQRFRRATFSPSDASPSSIPRRLAVEKIINYKLRYHSDPTAGSIWPRERDHVPPVLVATFEWRLSMKVISRLLALGIAAAAIAACSPPPRDVVYRAPAHYSPNDERVFMAINLRQRGELSAH
jgi:hypothetical protein